MIIGYSEITEAVYNSLISLNNTNEFYEGENEELSMNFGIELSSFLDFISEKDGSNKENYDFEVGHYIIAFISEGDGYSQIYQRKNQKKDSLLLLYYCNCQVELRKRQAKHLILDKQRDTPTFLERYNCEGIITIEIFSKTDLITIKYSHKMLHPRPSHIKTSLEIRKFIQNNINYSASEICQQIRENQINGYESITIQQTYFWWSIESHKAYCRHSNPLLSAKILLEESNLEIIIDSLDSFTPALGFLTTLFNRLIYNKFDAIEIDATYGTNNLSWKLYAIMGVVNRTGFPLSYLLISTGKN